MTDHSKFSPKPIVTLAVFDVCDTLYAQNTTFGFVRYLMRHTKRFHIFDRTLMFRWSPVFLSILIIGKIAKKDYLRNIYLRWLKGRMRWELESAADAYVAEVLQPLALVETHAKFDKAKSQGQAVYLCSASIDCVVDAIARRLGARCYSSKLHYVNDTCTGKLVKDLTGTKKEIVMNIPGVNVGVTHIRVFTDNISDMDLVKIADDATIILPGGRGKEKWAGFSVEFVDG
jgi:phosphoserine phosphatase